MEKLFSNGVNKILLILVVEFTSEYKRRNAEMKAIVEDS